VSTLARRDNGVAFVPEDRHEEGLLLDAALWENIYLGREHAYGRSPLIPEPALREDTARAIADFDVRPATPDASLRTLSGGNQQKLLIARELLRAPRVLVCAQPTRGVDIGAIAEIHARLIALADAGAAILLFSAELDELFALADRVIVLYRGRAIGEHLLRGSTDREAARARIGAEMVGLAAEGAA
jgi:general nucleoside transport system ATP-binding protein